MAVPSVNLPLTIAVVQFCPKIGRVQENIAKANELLASLQPRSVDLVCLPEMIFTGYAFPNSAAILPHLEEPKTGPTSTFCASLARRLACHVVAGYPERLKDTEIPQRSSNGPEIVGANSAVLYGPDGEWIGRYRKTNLFETDMPWAKAGTGFATFHLPPPLHTLCLGICMDLNVQPPHDWTLSDGPYELADYCIEQQADILLLLNSWLESSDAKNSDKDSPDWNTINYWSLRLEPLWAERDNKQLDDTDRRKEMTVVICNRTGEENGVKFAGSSSVFRMTPGAGRGALLNKMTRCEEGVRIWRV
ncbi:hypothetical protein HGRIS_010143 [Hohenbuehelia grisea]|uniref:CN hydrolase domain-containing protein n=1 Tax=Hohenbuehelia grisea TaxID=104357 RepID=A0ABR3J3S2_9AGAR